MNCPSSRRPARSLYQDFDSASTVATETAVARKRFRPEDSASLGEHGGGQGHSPEGLFSSSVCT
eukprot:7292512-Prorocentrum_lima.AAC.1